MPHFNALVIKVLVANCKVWRVYVDNGMVVSILYMEYFHKLEVDKSYL